MLGSVHRERDAVEGVEIQVLRPIFLARVPVRFQAPDSVSGGTARVHVDVSELCGHHERVLERVQPEAWGSVRVDVAVLGRRDDGSC